MVLCNNSYRQCYLFIPIFYRSDKNGFIGIPYYQLCVFTPIVSGSPFGLLGKELYNATGAITVIYITKRLKIVKTRQESFILNEIFTWRWTFLRDVKGKSETCLERPWMLCYYCCRWFGVLGWLRTVSQQHVMTKCRAGKYVGDISTMALFTLCNIATRIGKDIDNIVSTSLLWRFFVNEQVHYLMLNWL